MGSFRHPTLVRTDLFDDVDFDLAKQVIRAGEDREALVQLLGKSTKGQVEKLCKWICSDSPQSASIALVAAKAVDAGGAKRAVAKFIDMRSELYAVETVRQARKILEPKS
jgi:hypothetical protein